MSKSTDIPTGRVERLELKTVVPGDVLRITTGIGELALHYTFLAEEAGTWPIGQLQETRPDGTTLGPFPISLHGSGRWTTRKQNPVQTQDRAFTSYFDSINYGDFLVVATPDPKLSERLIFDKPGQEISEVVIERQPT